MAKKAKAPKIDPYVEGFMGKLLDRLTSIEKKMEVVIAQTSTKASSGAAGHPKPSPGHDPAAPRRERTLYEAICAACHKICEVPFRPSENRPVYCKECFAKKKQGGGPPSGIPVLTPVALPPKPASKLSSASHPASTARTAAPVKVPATKKSSVKAKSRTAGRKKK